MVGSGGSLLRFQAIDHLRVCPPHCGGHCGIRIHRRRDRYQVRHGSPLNTWRLKVFGAVDFPRCQFHFSCNDLLYACTPLPQGRQSAWLRHQEEDAEIGKGSSTANNNAVLLNNVVSMDLQLVFRERSRFHAEAEAGKMAANQPPNCLHLNDKLFPVEAHKFSGGGEVPPCIDCNVTSDDMIDNISRTNQYHPGIFVRNPRP